MRKFIQIIEATADQIDQTEIDRCQAFEELARGQRGTPEIAMVRAQAALRGGVLSYVIEHVGDLTHRMAQYPEDSAYQCGYELVKPKVDRCFGMLNSRYVSRRTGGTGFQEEHMENMRNNAADQGITAEEFLAKVRPSLRKYAEAHKALAVYNYPQALARDAAVALGEERFEDAQRHLKHLGLLLDSPETWVKFASKYEPGYGRKTVTEAPISDIEFHGPTEPQSLRADDIGIVTSPKARVKIARVLEKAPIPIKLVFVNHDREYVGDVANPNRFTVRPGEHHALREPASGMMSPDEIETALGVRIERDPHVFTAVLSFNEGDDRRPFTPWMIAHRLGHLIEERGRRIEGGLFNQQSQSLQEMWRNLDYEDKRLVDIQNILHEIGTFKSARDGTVRGPGEFVIECFAQFLISGRIKLRKLGPVVQERANALTRVKHPKLAAELDKAVAKGKTREIPNPARCNEVLDMWREQCEQDWHEELQRMVGKIVVM